MSNFYTRSTHGSRSGSSRKRTAVRSSGAPKTTVPMARESMIPAGNYRARVVKVTETTTQSTGAPAIEVVYELTTPDGQLYQMREIIPLDSLVFVKWCDAMVAAGLDPDGYVDEAVGFEEDVTLSYPTPNGLGRFTKRKPATSAPAAGDDTAGGSQDDDDELDDLLEDFDEK